jgi:hypothetical protein
VFEKFLGAAGLLLVNSIPASERNREFDCQKPPKLPIFRGILRALA